MNMESVGPIEYGECGPQLIRRIGVPENMENAGSSEYGECVGEPV